MFEIFTLFDNSYEKGEDASVGVIFDMKFSNGWFFRPCLGCDTWTLNSKLKVRQNSFGTANLRKILWYRWFDFLSNERVLRMTSMSNISDMMVTERQMLMFGHVDELFRDDPVHRIISCLDSPEWRRKPDRPLSYVTETDRWSLPES